MNAVFTDSGYFIGRLDRHDFLHQRATTLAAKYDAQVTTEFVLLEVLNALSGAATPFANRGGPVVQSAPSSAQHHYLSVLNTLL